jgi:hypothetical protein
MLEGNAGTQPYPLPAHPRPRWAQATQAGIYGLESKIRLSAIHVPFNISFGSNVVANCHEQNVACRVF